MLDANIVSILSAAFLFAALWFLRWVALELKREKLRSESNSGITKAPPWVLISPSSGIIPFDGQDISIYTTDNLDPQSSVHDQCKQEGLIALWVGFTKKRGFKDFNAFIDAAKLHPRIQYVFVYEEIFWEIPGILALGAREAEILSAADYAKNNGLSPIIMVMPDVVLHPNFFLKSINTYGVIAINDFPSVNPTIRLNDNIAKCTYSNNLTTNLLFLSVTKLRAMGFTGEIWYVYQAFGLTDLTPEGLVQDFKEQKETIRAAKDIGIDVVVPYGLYFGKEEISRKPTLFQGHGTEYEQLIRPPTVNS